jgi:hypothetical protein
MKDFFSHLEHNHKNAIKNIKDMIDVNDEEKQKYPEYGTILTRKTGMTEFRLKKIQRNSTKKLKHRV